MLHRATHLGQEVPVSGPAGGPLPAVLALDAGTSSVRGCLFGADGAALGRPSRSLYPWTVTPDGGMEADPAALLAAACEALDGAVAEARSLGVEVRAVAVDTFWHGLLGLGADGRPVTPVYGWGDSRARAWARKLAERVDAAEAHRRTGCWVHESYPAAKLPWLRETRGDTFRRAAAWVSPGEWLALEWFGERGVSLSVASGTGLLDGRRLCWDEEMLAAAGIGEEMLSPLVDAGAAFRGLRGEYAGRWPALAKVPWLPAVGDGACANLGSGAAGRRRMGVTVATSAAVRALREEGGGDAAPGLWRYRLDARRAVCGRAFSNAGSGFAWLRRTFALPPPAALEAALAAMEPDAHGLTVLPTLLGERPPATADDPAAAVAGMTAATTPVQVARAWLEAVAFHVADGVDAVEGALGPAETVVAGGGALHASPAWAQVLADVLGRALLLPVEGEDTARGAALLALEFLGWVDDATDVAARPLASAARIEPDPACHEVYRRARERQRRLEAVLEERR